MAQPAPTETHRPRRPRLRIGAAEPAVRSFSPAGRSFAHYGPYAPTLRPVPRSASPPTPDSVKLQHHRQRAGPLQKSQPAAPTEAHRPGPPPDGRPASADPPPDTRKPQIPRQRGSTPLDGWPAAPTANPRPGPPHSGPSGRTALRASACRQPVPPFGRPLAALTRRQPTAPAQVANAQGRRFPMVSISHARPPGRSPRTIQKNTGITPDSAEAKPGCGRMLRRLPQRH